MRTKVKHYEDLRRFEVQSEGHTAYLTYILRGRIMDIVHTYVPRPIRDRGIAAALVEAAYNYARRKISHVMPLVPMPVPGSTETAELSWQSHLKHPFRRYFWDGRLYESSFCKV